MKSSSIKFTLLLKLSAIKNALALNFTKNLQTPLPAELLKSNRQ